MKMKTNATIQGVSHLLHKTGVCLPAGMRIPQAEHIENADTKCFLPDTGDIRTPDRQVCDIRLCVKGEMQLNKLNILLIVTSESQYDPKRQNLKSALCVKGGTHPQYNYQNQDKFISQSLSGTVCVGKVVWN